LILSHGTPGIIVNALHKGGDVGELVVVVVMMMIMMANVVGNMRPIKTGIFLTVEAIFCFSRKTTSQLFA
jgi:hypothetical protein